jgi:chemotaxis protein methyltransferase WspC
MSHARITDLLRQTMGLEAESIGVACVERAVSKRLAARGLRELQSYWELLRTSAEELQQLIEAIVIPETWFFRDSEAFAAMVRVVRAEWLAKHPAGTLRLLSLPCSTGEEPFSIAMALLDGGLAPSRFHIDAIDISVRAIACAERAIYGKNSFRAKDLGFRDRYFEPVERGHRLSDLVRRQVSFRHGNLLSADGRQGADPYEVIFCRNVLIYFDRVSQHRAIEVLGRLLTPAGLLFVGPSETGLLLDRGFVPAGIPLAFAFRRAGGAAAPVVAAKPVAAKPIPEKPRQPASAPKSTPEPIPPDAIVAAAEPWIAQARRLADQGKLVEALACCEQNLRAEAASAETFHLVGLLHDAAGRVHDAAEHYRKALYLDPRHPEALIHLAVALQKAGDARGAQRLFERANRQATPIASKRGG